MRWLLDVNVLIAMLDRNHLAHASTTDWFAVNGDRGWCSTPTTQNAVIRIMSGAAYRESRLPPDVIAARLEALLRVTAHTFLSDDVSILDHQAIDLSRMRTGGSVTDTYLLALAVAHDLTLVTLDRRIDASVVTDGPAHLLVIE